MDETTSQFSVPHFLIPSCGPALGFGKILICPNNKYTPDSIVSPLIEIGFFCLQLKNPYLFILPCDSCREEIIWSNITPAAQEKTVILSRALGNT